MKRLALLDYGRFFAAMMVVAFHYTFNGIANGKIDSISHIPSVIEVTKYGYLGVELFFMISGYVIFFSAQNKSAAEFAESRILRLYPAYWVAILFTSFFAMLWGGEMMSVTLEQIIINFTMLQGFLGVDAVDGVYWSLAFELVFYFEVFLLLLFGLQKYLKAIFIFWPAIFCIAIVADTQSILIGGYFYYFSAGSLFAILAEKFDWKAAFGLLVTYILCIDFSANTASPLRSPVIIGLIITSYFILFAYQNTKNGRSLTLPMSRMAGSLSYPIYLIHAYFGYMFLSQFANEKNKFFVYLLTLFLVLVTSYMIHIVIEKRFHFVWKNLFHYIIGWPLGHVQKIPKQIQLAYNKRFH